MESLLEVRGMFLTLPSQQIEADATFGRFSDEVPGVVDLWKEKAVKCGALLASVFALLLVPSTLSASTDGLEAGGLSLAPRFRIETGYDTNAFYRSTDATRPTAVKLDLVPSLSVSTLTPRVVDFGASANARFEQYLGGDDEAQREAFRRMGGVDLGLATFLRLNPQGVVSLMPALDYRRSNDPSSNASGDAWRNTYNQASVEIGLHPGGAARTSRMGISGYLRGFHRLYRFNLREQLDRDSLGGEVRLNWNILPKSAFFVLSSISTIRYKEPFLTTNVQVGDNEVLEVANANSNAMPVRVSGGFDGLVTRRFGLLVRGGYGMGNYESGETVNTFVGQAQATVYPNQRTNFRLGYNRDVADSNLGNFLTFNRIYTGVTSAVGKLQASAIADVTFTSYARIENPTFNGVSVYGTDSRQDTLLGGTLDLVYKITPWFGTGANYRLQVRDSNFSAASVINVNEVDPTSSASFTRHAVSFVLQFGY